MVRASRQFLQDCSSFVPRCGRWMDTSRASTRRPQACLGYRRAGHSKTKTIASKESGVTLQANSSNHQCIY
jgi:hypothetical protein